MIGRERTRSQSPVNAEIRTVMAKAYPLCRLPYISFLAAFSAEAGREHLGTLRGRFDCVMERSPLRLITHHPGTVSETGPTVIPKGVHITGSRVGACSRSASLPAERPDRSGGNRSAKHQSSGGTRQSSAGVIIVRSTCAAESARRRGATPTGKRLDRGRR